MNEDTPRVLVTPERLVGKTIDGRYRLEAILGSGGMGVVYRTHQESLRRDVAIKLLKLDDANDRHRTERFDREIGIVAQLNHPNIVHVFDSGRDEALGLSYVVMELVDGVTLDELLRGHRLSGILAIDIAYEICAALTEPHAKGVVHRDIKPANVLVTTRSDDTVGVKVVDFGIARSSRASGKGKITTTGVVVGSPMYMAPEVARGESLDGRTDLYSVGVVLFEMLTGLTPFRGSTPVAIMLRQAVEDPPSLADAMSGEFPYPELVELVDSMLEKDRRKRPEDARKVLRRLERIRSRYNLGRVRVAAGSHPLEALAGHRIPIEREYDEEFFDDDPEAPTATFSGWLLPHSAQVALAHDGGSSEPARAQPSAMAWVAAVVVLVAAVAGAVMSWTAAPKEAVEIGLEPGPTSDEAPALAVPPSGSVEPRGSVEESFAERAADAGAPSEGKDAATARVEPPAPEPAVEVIERPAPVKARPEAEPKEPVKVDNLDWIRRK